MSSDDHDERTCAIALALTDRIGWKLIHRLLDRFGTLTLALDASTDELQTVPGIGQRIAASIHAINLGRLDADVRRFEAQGITLALWQDAIYPERLKTLDDKPLVLFWKGTLDPADAPAVAIVGTRGPAASSVQRAYRLAAAFARRGWVVISGLARGIDTAAHSGALLAGGRTLAILGCGVNVVYPPENWRLAGQVRASGALIVVEAPDNSGALHAARYAHAQGRLVFALDNSAGNAALLRDFASPLPDDIEALAAYIEASDGQT
jgi:DNA processing protein